MQVYIVCLLIGFIYSLVIFFIGVQVQVVGNIFRNFCYVFILFIECLIIFLYNFNFIFFEFIIICIKFYCIYIIFFYFLVLQNFLYVWFEKFCKNKIFLSLLIIKDDLIFIIKCKLIENFFFISSYNDLFELVNILIMLRLIVLQ